MRKTLGIGIGATAVAALALGGISVARAAAPARGDWSAVASTASTTPASSTVAGVSMAEARRLAQAAVPGGHVVQIESDDQADRPVWKVTVAGPAGRVIVLVDVASGAVTAANPSNDPTPKVAPTKPDDDAAGTPDDDATRGSDDHGGRSGTDDRHGKQGHGHDDPPGHR